MKFCNQDISKTITARSFKLGQLIEDNEKITGLKFLKKLFFFFSYCPLQIFYIENLISQKPLQLGAPNLDSS